MTKRCSHCNTEITQRFCPNCGHPAELKRVDSSYVINEIASVLSFEKGILHTIKELATTPGKSIREFLLKDRNRLVKPIVFIIITSLIYTLVVHFFHIEDGYVDYSFENANYTAVIFQWIQEHYGYANLFMGLFIGLWIKLFFRKHGYNIFEILILLCFAMGMGMLVFALFGLMEGLTGYRFMKFAGMLGVTYITWAVGQFFESKISNYIKAFFSYILGMLTFTIFALLMGTILDKLII